MIPLDPPSGPEPISDVTDEERAAIKRLWPEPPPHCASLAELHAALARRQDQADG
jgi:hypothetical protein